MATGPVNDGWETVSGSSDGWETVPAAPSSVVAGPRQPQGIGDRLATWAQNAANDIRDGGDTSAVGKLMRFMGAKGAYNGTSPQTAEFMASVPLGLLKAAKGGGEVATGGGGWQGTKDIVGGLLQASEIPSAFVGGPEAAAVGDVGHGAVATKTLAATAKGAQQVGRLIPSAERAGQGFSEVMAAAGNVPVNVNAPGNIALRTQELANAGGSMPKVVKDFLKRVTAPDAAPVTYKEARDFYSNATRLSSDETRRLTPVMRKQVAEFTSSLGKSITDAADQAGKAAQYKKAMDEYRKAMLIRGMTQNLADMATGGVGKAVAGAAGAAGAYQFLRQLFQ